MIEHVTQSCSLQDLANLAQVSYARAWQIAKDLSIKATLKKRVPGERLPRGFLSIEDSNRILGILSKNHKSRPNMPRVGSKSLAEKSAMTTTEIASITGRSKDQIRGIARTWKLTPSETKRHGGRDEHIYSPADTQFLIDQALSRPQSLTVAKQKNKSPKTITKETKMSNTFSTVRVADMAKENNVSTGIIEGVLAEIGAVPLSLRNSDGKDYESCVADEVKQAIIQKIAKIEEALQEQEAEAAKGKESEKEKEKANGVANAMSLLLQEQKKTNELLGQLLAVWSDTQHA